jgi:DNA-directed RNA polymerase II subunit RPB2
MKRIEKTIQKDQMKILSKKKESNVSKNNKVDKVTTSVNDLNIVDIFKFTDLYFNRAGIMYSHLYNSFNKLLDEDIKNFLERGDNTFFEKLTRDKVIKYKFEYSNISIRPPMLPNEDEIMFPSDARNRSITYSSRLIATVTQIQEITDIATDEVERRVVGVPEDEVPIANIPIMLKSKFCSLTIKKGYDKKECDYDQGGYFIVNGSEKVVISQDSMCPNKPLVFIKKDAGAEVYTVQVNSKSQKNSGLIQVIAIKMKKDNTMSIKVPILSEMPVFILLRALGLESDRDIINYTVYSEKDSEMVNFVRISLDNTVNEKGVKIQTQQDAIEYLLTKMRVIKKYSETDKNIKQQQKRSHLMSLLENNFLPHIEGGLMYKAYYIGYMINRLLRCYLKRIPADDRDSYVNKRIDLPGNLLEELFRQHYRKMLNECNKYFKKRNTSDENPLPIINQIKPNIIEQGIKTSLLTGSWGRKKGVAQMLQRLTYLQILTFLRRFDSPSVDASTNKLTSPRHLHPSSVGNACVVETPEHANVGLVKHLSMIGNITIMSNSQHGIIKSFLKNKLINIRDVVSTKLKNYTKIFLNGEWLGLNNDPLKLEADIRHKRSNGAFDNTVAIINDIKNKEIRLYCDGGRLFRPVIKIKENVSQLTKDLINQTSLNQLDNDVKITDWDEFMVKHPDIVEYIDMEEQPYLMIAPTLDEVEDMRKRMIQSINKVKLVENNNVYNRYDDMRFVKYTHCEFHPSLLVGVITANIPFCNHNAGARNIFQYSQGRQAMGIYASNYRDRLDISYILFHPQKPLVSTRTSKYVYTDVLPSGENVIVAFACYTG